MDLFVQFMVHHTFTQVLFVYCVASACFTEYPSFLILHSQKDLTACVTTQIWEQLNCIRHLNFAIYFCYFYQVGNWLCFSPSWSPPQILLHPEPHQFEGQFSPVCLLPFCLTSFFCFTFSHIKKLFFHRITMPICKIISLLKILSQKWYLRELF